MYKKKYKICAVTVQSLAANWKQLTIANICLALQKSAFSNLIEIIGFAVSSTALFTATALCSLRQTS